MGPQLFYTAPQRPHTYIAYKDLVITDRSYRPALPKPPSKQSMVPWRSHHRIQLHATVSRWLKVVRNVPSLSLPWWVLLGFCG